MDGGQGQGPRRGARGRDQSLYLRKKERAAARPWWCIPEIATLGGRVGVRGGRGG